MRHPYSKVLQIRSRLGAKLMREERIVPVWSDMCKQRLCACTSDNAVSMLTINNMQGQADISPSGRVSHLRPGQGEGLIWVGQSWSTGGTR